MEKSISKEVESDLLKLGVYQLIGGSLGILIVLWGLYISLFLTGLTALLYIFILVFFAFSIFCGTLCMRINKNALRYSFINQILQIVGFAMMGLAFKYVAGFYLTIGLDLTNSIQFDFGAGISKFEFSFNNEPEKLELNFNLIAIAITYWIDKLLRKIKDQEAIRRAASIGEE